MTAAHTSIRLQTQDRLHSHHIIKCSSFEGSKASSAPSSTDPTQRQSIHIGHSPDPDDAFMWYPLANFPDGSGPGGKSYSPTIDTGQYDFVHVLEDIQSLNDRAERPHSISPRQATVRPALLRGRQLRLPWRIASGS